MSGILPCFYCGDHHENWGDCRHLPAAAPREIRERDVEEYLTRRVKKLGGEIRKVKWIGRNSAPDRYVLVPPREDTERFLDALLPRIAWVEVKRPGEKATSAQQREHDRLRRLGARVEVLDTFEAVDKFLGD